MQCSKVYATERIVTYVAASAKALMARLMDLRRKIAAQRNRPASMTMMIENTCTEKCNR